jgi:intein/homing endonuclease
VYTREYFNGIGIEQGSKLDVPVDCFHNTSRIKENPVKDNSMKDYLEHRLGGGRVAPQKQFLENDRKVLKFNAKYDSLKYIIHYFLADDTVEVREMHSNNRYKFFENFKNKYNTSISLNLVVVIPSHYF